MGRNISLRKALQRALEPSAAPPVRSGFFTTSSGVSKVNRYLQPSVYCMRFAQPRASLGAINILTFDQRIYESNVKRGAALGLKQMSVHDGTQS